MKKVNQSYEPTVNDYTLILFTDSEARCRGLFDKLENDKPESVKIFSNGYDKKNANDAQSLFGGKIIDVKNSGEMELVSAVSKNIESEAKIVVDISILNQLETFLLMNLLDENDSLSNTDIIYSTPENYTSIDDKSSSKGIGTIESVPGFVNCSPLNQNILLIMLLGFEPARSTAIYHNYDPDETHLILPYPPYKEEWEEKTYYENSRLIHEIGEERAHKMHSKDPSKFVQDFMSMIENNDLTLEEFNTYLSPLSTKPQTIGLYYIWRENEKNVSLIHSEPLEKNKLFTSNGIQETWEIMSSEDEI